jgi:hypothetical protein
MKLNFKKILGLTGEICLWEGECYTLLLEYCSDLLLWTHFLCIGKIFRIDKVLF